MIRIFLLLFLILSSTAYGQSGFEVSRKIPPSPTAASIEKYGNLPMNYYSGNVNVSIPLYELRLNGFSLPISINGSSGGIKPAEIPGWVGSNWMLSAGGAITRTVVGLPDDDYNGYFNNLERIRAIQASINYNGQVAEAELDNIRRGELDIQTDEYSFSCGNYSGQFFFDSYGEVKTKPYSDVKIIREEPTLPDHGTGAYVNIWRIFTPDGNEYVFSAKEWSNNDGNKYHIAAWYLTEIKTKNNQSITFTYTMPNGKYRYKEYAYQKVGMANFRTDGEPYTNQLFSTNNTNACWDEVIYLNGITTPTETVTFYTSKRNDLKLYPINGTTRVMDEMKLDSMVVLNYGQRKKFQFNYNESIRSRLQLKEVAEVSTSGKLKKHQFEYFGNLEAPYNTFATDHWGYYNGKSNLSSLPATEINIAGTGSNNVLGDADRSPDFSSALTGALRTVYYPTGGSTTFEYEPNDYTTLLTPMEEELSRDYYGETNYNENGFNQRPDYPARQGENFTITSKKQVKLSWVTSTDYTGCQGADSQNSIWIELQAGTYNTLDFEGYALSGIGSGGPMWCLNRVQLYIHYTDKIPVDKVKSGGLRIKSVSDLDNVTNKTVVRKYKYYPRGNPNYSSGSIGSKPEYLCYINEAISMYCRWVWFLQSSPVNTLSYTKGSQIGYSQVHELRDDGSETQYDFTSFDDYPDIKSTYMIPFEHTFGANTNQDHLRGLPTSVKQWDASGKLVKETKYSYSLRNFSATPIQQFQVYPLMVIKLDKPEVNLLSGRELKTECMNKISEEDIDYSSGQPTITAVRKSYYENTNNNFLTKSEAIDSRGLTRTSNIIYAHNAITALTGTLKQGQINGINALLSYNRLNDVIEQRESFNGVLLKKTRTSYTKWADKIVLPDSIESATSSAPFEKRLTFNSYDSNGNPLDISKANGPRICYIYDYKQTLPIAEINNATLPNTAYASFEADSKGNLAFNSAKVVSDATAPIGEKCYSLSTVTTDYISKTGLTTSKSYTLSYWVKSGTSLSISGATLASPVTVASRNGWTLYERTISNASSINFYGTGSIDDIRLYPVEAQINTYTYDPLLGMTSSTDTKGQTTYYVYDDFGRLQYTKDMDGNILKEYSYNYSVTPSYYYNSAKSQVFIRNNCSAGSVGSSVTYTVAAGKHSSSISQADADSKAQNDITANGQTYANTYGTCTPTYYNTVKSQVFTKNDCAAGSVGSSVTYTVAANKYSSIISQADADSKAQNDINANGQTYANTNGTCITLNTTFYLYSSATFACQVIFDDVTNGKSYPFTIPASSGSMSRTELSFPATRCNITVKPVDPYAPVSGYKIALGSFTERIFPANYSSVDLTDSSNLTMTIYK